MIGKYDRNTAEVLFYKNLNQYIKVELINGEIFEGQLLGISCNTFIVESDEEVNEMFRYEDVRFLRCLNISVKENVCEAKQ